MKLKVTLSFLISGLLLFVARGADVEDSWRTLVPELSVEETEEMLLLEKAIVEALQDDSYHSDQSINDFMVLNSVKVSDNVLKIKLEFNGSASDFIKNSDASPARQVERLLMSLQPSGGSVNVNYPIVFFLVIGKEVDITVTSKADPSDTLTLLLLPDGSIHWQT